MMATGTSTSNATVRVLIVEDNEDAAATLAKLLELDGHSAATARDAREACREAHRQWPDVALLDLRLPGADGLEIARWLREQERGADLLLVALTGCQFDDVRQQAREAGFDHYLLKPVHWEAIQDILTTIPPRQPEKIPPAARP